MDQRLQTLDVQGTFHVSVGFIPGTVEWSEISASIREGVRAEISAQLDRAYLLHRVDVQTGSPRLVWVYERLTSESDELLEAIER